MSFASASSFVQPPRHFSTPEERALMSPSSSPGVSPTSSPIYLPADSSPLSSPGLDPIDIDDDGDARPWRPSYEHPYAGSTNSTRRPPLYEKKPQRVRSEDDDVFVDVWKGAETKLPVQTPWTVPMAERTPIVKVEQTREQLEYKLWEETVNSAVDKAKGIIDLASRNLTMISPVIRDLAHLHIMPVPPTPFFSTPNTPSTPRDFIRTQTDPASTAQRTRALFATRQPHLHTPNDSNDSGGLRLFLAQNQIVRLPQELFNLDRLTVLSIRNNHLEHIPPQICQLTSLRELNLSSNRLKYLPAEMSAMTWLKNLSITGNPWLPEPTLPASSPPTTSSSDGAGAVPNPSQASIDVRGIVQLPHATAGETKTFVTTRVPSLFELTYRKLNSAPETVTAGSRPLDHHRTLFSDTNNTIPEKFQRTGSSSPSPLKKFKRSFTRTPTNLSAMANPPLPADGPPNVLRALRGCGDIVAKRIPSKGDGKEVDGYVDGEDTTGEWSLKKCPNPLHGTNIVSQEPSPGSTEMGDEDLSEEWSWVFGGPPFLHPAEERFVWVEKIAGHKVGEKSGRIPLLWRGCSLGCLDFLAGRVEATGATIAEAH